MNEQQAFEEALRIQAVGAGTPTLTLDDVRGRATRIRRRRAAAGAAGAAALVAAAVVPLALLTGGDGSTDTLPPVSTPTVSDTANPPAPGPVDQRGFWVLDGEIHPPGGEPFTPDVDGEVASVTWLEDGRWVLGVYPQGRAFEVVVTDATGEVLATHEATDGALASDDAGGAVVWMHPEGRPRLLASGQGKPVDFSADLTGGRAPTELREVLPGCSAEDCVVLAESYDSSPDGSTDLAVSLSGERLPLDRLGLLSITDVSPDGALVSGMVTADELSMNYCYAIVVFATGEERWRTCDAGSFRFSPDGTMVLGVDAYLDGFGHSFTEVRSADDGTVVGRFDGPTVFDESWDSAGSYLVSVQANTGENLLLRLDPEAGEPEVVERLEGTRGDPSPILLGG